jgi:LysM repeat protein
VKYKRKWENNVKKALAENKDDNTANKGFNFDKLLAEVKELGDAVLSDDEKESPTSFPDLNAHNGVQLTWSEGGESLQEIAIRTGIHVNDLYEFNDKAYKIKEELLDKTVVYLEPKKSSFSGSRDTHEVRHGEKIIEIAQRYGVTEKSLRKRNYLKENEELKHGEVLYLKGLRTIRKPKLRKGRSNRTDSFTFTDI